MSHDPLEILILCAIYPYDDVSIRPK